MAYARASASARPIDADQLESACSRYQACHIHIRIDRPPMLRSAVRHTLVALILTTPSLAATPAEQRGKTFALTNCARCHSIDRVTQSPLKIAPPFRILHKRYPIETLA